MRNGENKKTECSTKLEALKEQCGRSSDKIKPDMPFGDWIDFWYQTYCRHTLRITIKNRLWKSHLQSHHSRNRKNSAEQAVAIRSAAILRKGKDRRKKTACKNLRKGTFGQNDKGDTCKLPHCFTAGGTGQFDTNQSAVGCKLPPKKKRGRCRCWRKTILRFLHQAKEEGYYELFLLELGTGMRRGEILALKWSDLNFATGELRIERQVYIIKAEVIISAPKTKASIRTVILPPSLLKTLVAYKETVDSEWMFPSPTDNGRPRNPSSVRKRLQLILERAGCKRCAFMICVTPLLPWRWSTVWMWKRSRQP